MGMQQLPRSQLEERYRTLRIGPDLFLERAKSCAGLACSNGRRSTPAETRSRGSG